MLLAGLPPKASSWEGSLSYFPDARATWYTP